MNIYGVFTMLDAKYISINYIIITNIFNLQMTKLSLRQFKKLVQDHLTIQQQLDIETRPSDSENSHIILSKLYSMYLIKKGSTKISFINFQILFTISKVSILSLSWLYVRDYVDLMQALGNGRCCLVLTVKKDSLTCNVSYLIAFSYIRPHSGSQHFSQLQSLGLELCSLTQSMVMAHTHMSKGLWL